tara:strand:- start:146 stop:847 length:702 start_codon:yes stop_codon:yes gene_type:complete
MKLPIFKCRASATGQIMTNPRSGKGLSATCVTHLEDWAKQQLYQRRKEFKSKQTTKGLEREDASIVFAGQHFGWEGAIKCTEQFEDDFFTGMPDVILPHSVEDIKNAWDAFTFPLFATKIPAKMKGYEYQGRTYMALTGKENFGLVYTLMDAPESIVEKEARYKMYDSGEEELSVALFNEVKAHLSYEHLAPALRINRFAIEADAVILAQMQQRVLDCRAYIETHIQPKFQKL